MTFNKNNLRKLFFLVAFCFFEGHFFSLSYVTQFDAGFFNIGYAHVTSNLNFVEGTAHNIFFGAGIEEKTYDCNFTTLVGFVPDKLIFRADNSLFLINNLNYSYLDFDFHKHFENNCAFSSKAFFGNAYTNQSNLYIVNGDIEVPLYSGCLINFVLPEGFDFQFFGFGGKFYSYNDNSQMLAHGDISLIDVKGGKSFDFTKLVFQSFYCGLGFSYLSGIANLKATTDNQNTIFFPFTYLYADATASLYFANLLFNYKISKGDFNLKASGDFRINCRSYLNYFYKYSMKKNLMFDGSNDSVYKDYVFSNVDFIFDFSLYAEYLISQINTKLYCNKIIFLPVITQKTKKTFGQENSHSTLDFSKDKREFIKMILLSGLTIGMKIEL